MVQLCGPAEHCWALHKILLFTFATDAISATAAAGKRDTRIKTRNYRNEMDFGDFFGFFKNFLETLQQFFS
jgi:hypothetical protein